jgi:hypothetical protein
MQALRAVSAAYGYAHSRRPLMTSMSLGFVIAGVGDAVCQWQERGEEIFASGGFDFRRLAELCFVRAFVMGPMNHLYFPQLARLIPGNSWPRTIARVVVDSSFAAPISLCIVFAATSTLKGKPEDIIFRVQDRLVPTWMLGVQYWPFVHLLNFKFIPPPHQGLVAHFASVWWMVQISNASNRALGKKGEAHPSKG